MASLIAPSLAVGVEGLLSQGCTGEPIFGFTFDGASACNDISGYVDTGSIAVNNFVKDQQVNFFDDTNCTVIRATYSSPICYEEQVANTMSFQVDCLSC